MNPVQDGLKKPFFAFEASSSTIPSKGSFTYRCQKVSRVFCEYFCSNTSIACFAVLATVGVFFSAILLPLGLTEEQQRHVGFIRICLFCGFFGFLFLLCLSRICCPRVSNYDGSNIPLIDKNTSYITGKSCEETV